MRASATKSIRPWKICNHMNAPDGEQSLSGDFVEFDQEVRNMIFVCYPKCSTCQKARKYLDEKGMEYTLRDIKLENPSAEELRTWWTVSGLPLKKFFNTSGLQYKALGLKDKLPTMTEEEQLALLSSDGMLVKRPILVGEGFVRVGFREKEWEDTL